MWIEFRFPIEGGERGRIVVANSQLRHASKLLDDFANYSPIYPTTVGTTDDQRVQFLRNLVAACNRPLELIPDRTGFFDPCTFVTRSEILRSDGSRGPRCRLFDIAVPEPSKGGIFDRLSGSAKARAKRSVALIAKLERGYSNHPGHTIPAWISVLLTRDWSKRIVALADEFVSLVVPDGNGWERRFARKFGVVYAAMTLAVETGVLPWPEDLPERSLANAIAKLAPQRPPCPPGGALADSRTIITSMGQVGLPAPRRQADDRSFATNRSVSETSKPAARLKSRISVCRRARSIN